MPLLLDKLVQSGGVEKEDVKYITHRVCVELLGCCLHLTPFRVHGGTHRQPLKITKQHMERLEEMDQLSQFAPLHVRSGMGM